MSNKQINLVEAIINKIPSDLILPIQKARFIYIELAKVLEFNTTFNFTTSVNRFIIKNKHYDIHNLKDNQIVCHTWANIYIELLKLVGIKAHKVSKNHAWVIIDTDIPVYADATIGDYTDLSRIKHHDEIINFYPISVTKTDDLPQKKYIKDFIELMNETDEKIGYHKTQYEYLLQLKEKVSKLKSIKDKVDLILKEANIMNVGYYEETSYIQYAFTLCLNIEERRNIFASHLIKTQEDETVSLIRCISVLENNIYYYYLFQKDNGISSVTKDQIEDYATNNYGIYPKNNIPDLMDYPITFQISKSNISTFMNHIFTFSRNESFKQKTK